MSLNSPSSVAVSHSGGVVTLTWTNGDDYSGVRIYRNTTNSPAKLTSVSGGSQSFQDQPPTGTYYYWVQGYTDKTKYWDPEYGWIIEGGEETSIVASSPSSIAVSAPSVPSTPTMGTLTTSAAPLKVTVPCSGGGAGTTGYRIERAPDASGSPGTYAEIGTIGYTGSTVNYEDKDVSPSTKYWYRIRAYNGQGNSGYASAAYITTASVSVPSAPSITLTARNTALEVSISPGNDGTYPRGGFKLAWASSSPPSTYVTIGDTVKHTITNLTNGTTYYVRCKQVDTYGNESSASTEKSAAPSSGSDLPSTVGVVSLELVGKDTLHVWWAPSIPPSGETIDKYFMYFYRWSSSQWQGPYSFVSYGLDASLDGRYTTDGTVNTRYADWVKGERYRFCMYAHSASGWSPSYSPYAYCYIGPEAIGSIGSDIPEAGKMKLKWDSVPGADLYIIERKEARQTSPGTWGSYSAYIEIVRIANSYSVESPLLESFTDLNLASGVRYMWRITPYDKFGNTNTSSEYGPYTIDGQSVIDPDFLIATPSDGCVSLTWSAGTVPPPRKIAKYQITRNTSPSIPGANTIEVNATVTNFADGGTSGLGSLSNGTTYFYAVRAKDDLGNLSGWEISGAVTPRAPSAPLPPQNLVAYGQDAALIVTWTPSDAYCYVLYRKPDGGSYALQTAGASTTLSAGAAAGATTITVGSKTNMVKGDFLVLDDPSINPSGAEVAQITQTPATTTISITPLGRGHSAGCSVKEAFLPNGCKFSESPGVGSKIFFRVLGASGVLFSSFSNEDHATLGEPSRPTITAQAATNDIVISWTASSPGIEANKIAHYRFYWRIYGGSWSNANQVSGLAANLSSYTTVQVGANYEFKVEAVDTAGLVSEASLAVIASVQKPLPPAGLIAFAQEDNGVWCLIAQWSKPDRTTNDISYYRLYRKQEGGSYMQIGGNLTDTAYKDPFSGLTPGKRYYYYAVAYDSAGFYSNNSNVDSALVGEPERPTNIQLQLGDSQVMITWSSATPGSAPLSHYHVWMSTNGTSFSKIADDLNADPSAGAVINSYTKTGLTNGATYWFKVSVIDRANIESEYSETASTRPYLRPNPPRNVTAVPAGNLKILLMWDNPEP